MEIEKYLDDLKIQEIKTELAKRNMDTTGIKITLKNRLKQALIDEGEDPEEYRFTYQEQGDGNQEQQGEMVNLMKQMLEKMDKNKEEMKKKMDETKEEMKKNIDEKMGEANKNIDKMEKRIQKLQEHVIEKVGDIKREQEHQKEKFEEYVCHNEKEKDKLLELINQNDKKIEAEVIVIDNKVETKINIVEREIENINKKIDELPSGDKQVIYMEAGRGMDLEYYGDIKKNPIKILRDMKNTIQQKNQEENWKVVVSKTMKGKAELWWEMIREECEDWLQFENMFIEYFWSDALQSKIRENLYTGKYLEGGMPRENYAMKKLDNIKYLTPKVLEEDAIKYLARHFTNDIYEFIMVNNLKDKKRFLDYLRRIDDMKSMRTNYNREENNRRDGWRASWNKKEEIDNREERYPKNKNNNPQRNSNYGNNYHKYDNGSSRQNFPDRDDHNRYGYLNHRNNNYEDNRARYENNQQRREDGNNSNSYDNNKKRFDDRNNFHKRSSYQNRYENNYDTRNYNRNEPMDKYEDDRRNNDGYNQRQKHNKQEHDEPRNFGAEINHTRIKEEEDGKKLNEDYDKIDIMTSAMVHEPAEGRQNF